MQTGFFRLQEPLGFVPGRGVVWPPQDDLAESIAERVAAKLKRPEAPQVQPADSSLDRLYTISEVAALLKLDRSTVRRIFCDEPGIITHGKANRRDGKRDYQTYRIPRSVLLRKYPQLKRA
jgi:hypothetical protein